jgi:molecular chaperone DnaJ
MLGGKLKVKTMRGEVEVNIKPGTKDGTEIELKGHGMPNLPPN